MTDEVWKPIVGFEGTYLVSNFGKVKNVKTDKKLQQQFAGGEYPYIRLRRKKYYIHFLVATAFIGPKPFAKAEVRHFDNDKENPSASNLSWGTRKDNSLDKVRHGTSKRKFNNTEVLRIKILIAAGEKDNSIAKTFQVSHQTINNIRTGKSYFV